ncbi:nucleotide pyrophosphohydrolase [Bacillus phage vB_BceS_LY5]|uniref:nucleotide pyrophosphohydrolase n=1 Tax=Bacillus phage vB_BceS_LY5 TaxID=2996058 RepID=UPI0040550FE7|nr:nucleotide pyrophosphohydrolase [Bacillus phage vB_BceS_LY5]
MLPNKYQEMSRRTAPKDMSILNIALGLVGEAGEIADLIKKQEYHGHPINLPEIKKELGDLLWYFARLCDYNNSKFSEDISQTFQALQKEGSKGIVADGIIKTVIILNMHVNYISGDIMLTGNGEYSDAIMVFACIAKIATHFDIDLEEVAGLNIEKLYKRFPEGFSREASIARVDV